MAKRSSRHPGIEDRWTAPERKGKGQRWRLRMKGVPGHEGTVVELFDDLAEAEARRDQLKALAKSGGGRRIEAGRVRLSDIAEAYLASLEGHEDPPTPHYLDTVRLVLRRASEAGLEDVRAPGWPDAVMVWLSGLTAQRNGQKEPRPASEATRRAYRAILGGAINYAVDNLEWLELSPFRKVRAAKTKAKRLRLQGKTRETDVRKIIPVETLARLVGDEARWMVDQERAAVERALEAHGGDKVAAAEALGVHVSTIYNRLARPPRLEDSRWLVAVLMAYTGMRIGQALGLEWRDLDRQSRTIRLRPEVVGNKSGHDAVVEVEDELASILDGLVPAGPFVVPDPVSPAGRPMRRHWLHESFDRFLAAHGAKGHTAHDFRHSFVCMLTAMGIPTADVRRRVNHADVTMTSRYAEHMLAPYRRACADWSSRIRLRADWMRSERAAK